ncbi:MAG: DUF6279 family lipoprotein [Burkholderiaceae bacterium]
MTRVLRWLLCLSVVSLLAAGCSLARFGYDAFPYWAMWQLDRHLDLDDEQRVLARNAIDDLRAWHERAELPQYARFLKQVDARLRGVGGGADGADGPPGHGAVQGALDGSGAGTDASVPAGDRDAIRPVEFDTWRRTAMARWAPLADQVAGPVTTLLASLKPAQIERLKDRFADDNREMIKKYGLDSPNKVVQARADRIIERAEFFLGRLSAEQKRALREQAAGLPSSEALWLDEREDRQQALLALIARLQAEKPPATVGRDWTRDYLMSVISLDNPRRRQKLEHARQASDEMMVRVVNEASDVQRRHLSKRLNEFATDFERRAGKAG